jgi:hypothetical protein
MNGPRGSREAPETPPGGGKNASAPALLPDAPDQQVLAAQTYHLLCEELEWVHRRKEALTLLDQRMTRRQVSVDFALPGSIVPLALTRGGREVRYAPIFMLQKAPSRFTRFDFRDEAGVALALPTRSENGLLAAGVLRHAAAQRLGAKPEDQLARELAAIAESASPRSRGLAERFLADRGTAARRALVGDAEFRSLVRAFADSSILSIPIAGDEGMRRILKLSYDAPLADLAYDDQFLHLAGLRSYTIAFDLPFISARNFHFELQSPVGLEVMEAAYVEEGRPKLLRIARSFSRQLHFYSDRALAGRKALVFVQLRVSGDGFLGGAALAACLVALSIGACFAFAGQLAEATSTAPSLLMLFPGLVANYIARPSAHRLTSVLLANARRLLIVSGGLAFAGAARLSVISKTRPASASTLRLEFGALGILAVAIALLLLAARNRRIPRALSRQRSFKRDVKDAGAELEVAESAFSSPPEI